MNNGIDSRFIARRVLLARVQTIAGILFLSAISGLALLWLGLHWSWAAGLLAVWSLFPILGWYYSSLLVKRLMRCQELEPDDPEHFRLLEIMKRLSRQAQLEQTPPLLISPLPIPNAFATGRNPANSFVAVTEGLLSVGLNDEELEAIIAHELAHIKSRDVAISSMTAILGSIFALLLAQGIPGMFNAVFQPRLDSPLADKLEDKIRRKKRRFTGVVESFTSFVLMLAIFYLAGAFSRLTTMFVSRARESHADALAARWTGNPCALSSALQKIVLWMTFNGMDSSTKMLLHGIAPLLFVSPMHGDSELDPEKSNGIFARLRRWWQGLGDNHPPLDKRLDALDRMNGGTCRRVL